MKKKLYKLGLDFGTTTSVLSYYEDGELKTFRYGGETDYGTPYVPSVVLYEENDLLIGPFALEADREESKRQRYFKMSLPLTKKTRTDSMSAKELTADFVGELIKGNCPTRETFVDNHIGRHAFAARMGVESLVMAIPDMWKADSLPAQRRLREAVCDHLQLPLREFVSEPVAAAAFFSFRYRANNDEAFVGNVLVCDMGGGTFDVTLCRISDEKLIPVIQAGSGSADDFGIAGNYFDKKLIESCFGNVEPETFAGLMKELDDEKKKKAGRLEKAMAGTKIPNYIVYRLPHDTGRIDVTIEQIEEAFKGVRKSMNKVLKEILKEAGKKKVEIERVILVGGFAKFLLVQNAIRDFLKSKGLDADALIDLETLTRDDMAYAISYGACLIANGLVDTQPKFRHNISVVVTDAAGRDIAVPFIRAGTTSSKLPEQLVAPNGDRLAFTTGQEKFQIEFKVEPEQGHPFNRTGQFSISKQPSLKNERLVVSGGIDEFLEPYLILQEEENGESSRHSLKDIIAEKL